MSLSTHFGTHIDAPYHFVPEGKTIDRITPEQLIGPCEVISCEDVDGLIEPEHLKRRMPEGTERLLVKTRNSSFVEDHTFHEEFTAFSEESGAFLVAQGVRLLGIDYFSIGPYKNPAPVHRAFLGSGGVVIENLILSHVDPGSYTLCCLPLKIEGSGGAPARVVLGRPDG